MYQRMEFGLAALLLVAIVLLVGVASITRFLGSPIIWSVEIAQLCFVWICMLAADLALQQNRHFGLSIVLDSLTPRGRRIAEIINTMVKLQQYTFVCAPHPFQWAGAVAMDVDVSQHIADYRRKREMLLAGLADDYKVVHPGGAFYVFPKAPWGTGTEFVEQAISNNLLIIPGGIFSSHDTHFRISYAADDATIERGIEVLRTLARNR